MKSRQPPYLALLLVVAGVLAGHAAVGRLARRIGVETSVDALARRAHRPGQVVRIAQADILSSPRLRATEYDRRDPTGEKAHAFAAIADPVTGRKAVMLFWRSTFPDSRDIGTSLRTAVQGTVRQATAAEQARIRDGLATVLDGPADATFYLDEMAFDPVPGGVLVLGLLALGSVAAGTTLFLRGRRPAAPAPVALLATAAAARGASRRAVAPASCRTCSACGGEFPPTSRNCLVCKAPVEVEYFVAAALPFDGFDRYVPVLTTMLRVGEYQATQPLARIHTPYPYQHLDGFHAKGPGASAPLRLTGRGIPSLVTARALGAALKEKGIESVVVGSDELMQGPFPRPAAELRFDDEAITFTFWNGADREERTVRWSRLAIVLFSAALPMRGTMTLAREVKEAAPADPGEYLIDLYERDVPEGIRIAEHSFHRWEFLRNSGSERPGDRFGKLMELIEQHAREADIQYVTGAYRGARSQWRMNYYSRLAFLTGLKAGWAKQEGPPRLDGYEVLDKIGEGGMGAVYRARQKKLGRMVALKVISPHLAAQPNFAARFQAEARAVAALAHPNIVQVIDLAESGGRQFLAMEFVEGKTLLNHLKERRQLGEAEALRIAIDVARALDHAWKRGILHRDVKPENVFINQRGEVKLGDWGLAKDVERDLGLTDTGTTVGTPYYMSPEQARARKDLDVRSDLYALGATLYHLVTGQPPFRGGSPMEVIAKHLSAPPPDPRAVVPDLGAETAELILALMAKRPDERCRDAAEAIRRLEAALRAVEQRELVLT